MAIEHGDRRGIGFLQINAPVLQFLQRYRHPGDRAAHECAGPYDPEIAVEKLHLGFPRHRRWAIKAVQHIKAP